MFKKIWLRLKCIWELPDVYEKQYRDMFSYVVETNNRIGEHTVVHADVHFKHPSQVIVIGEYRHHDYVRVFDVDAKTLVSLIEMLHNIEKNAKVGRFDMPNGMSNLSVVYPRERF